MADYTTAAKVTALLPPGKSSLDDATSDPSLAQVNVWITQVTNTLNVALVNSGATLPIAGTETDYLGWLDMLCAKECAFLVMQASGAAEEKASLWQKYHEEYMAALESIMDGDLLPGAGTTPVGGGTVRSYTMDAETNNDTTMAPIFTTDKQY